MSYLDKLRHMESRGQPQNEKGLGYEKDEINEISPALVCSCPAPIGPAGCGPGYLISPRLGRGCYPGASGLHFIP
jgi:hypothetical protein